MSPLISISSFICLTVGFLASICRYGISPFSIFIQNPTLIHSSEHIYRLLSLAIPFSIGLAPLYLYPVKYFSLYSNLSFYSPFSFLFTKLLPLALFLGSYSTSDLIITFAFTTSLTFLTHVSRLFLHYNEDILNSPNHLRKRPIILIALGCSVFQLLGFCLLINFNELIKTEFLKSLLNFDLLISSLFIFRTVIVYFITNFPSGGNFLIFSTKSLCFSLFNFIILVFIIGFNFKYYIKLFQFCPFPEYLVLIFTRVLFFIIIPYLLISTKYYKKIQSFFKQSSILSNISIVDSQDVSDSDCVFCRDSLASQQSIKLFCNHFLHLSCYLELRRSQQTAKCPICFLSFNFDPNHNLIEPMIEMFPNLSRIAIYNAISNGSNNYEQIVEYLLSVSTTSQQISDPITSSITSSSMSHDTINEPNVPVFASSFHENQDERHASLQQRIAEMREFGRRTYRREVE
ncbi:hypothetical protein RCL1_005006 [Eukaryota sp. TZLM3-RCL]